MWAKLFSKRSFGPCLRFTSTLQYWFPDRQRRAVLTYLFNCRGVRIYVLIRVSSKKTLQHRVNQEIFENRLFETLKATFADEHDFHSMIVRKVVPIAGDIALNRLGISDQDLAMIQRDTNVVFHAAAAVSFTSPLGISLDVNITFLTNMSLRKKRDKSDFLSCVASCHTDEPPWHTPHSGGCERDA